LDWEKIPGVCTWRFAPEVFLIHVQRPQESKIIKLLKNYGPCVLWWAAQQMGKSLLAGVCCGLTLDSRFFDVRVVTYLHLWHLKEIVPLKGQSTWKANPIVTQPKNVDDSLVCCVLTLGNELKVAAGSHQKCPNNALAR